ncbi:MAG: c-type cytochrome [Hyphomicrobiales bacterium]|nr:c-type cytochrome [Hyphomicrobiales bacterium]
MMRATFLVVLLLAATASQAQDGGTLERRGRTLAERMCASCHAIGKDGHSPHSGAPEFRRLDQRIDLDGFMGHLREGITVGHPDMPDFRFTREDARAFVLYIRSIQSR